MQHGAVIVPQRLNNDLYCTRNITFQNY